MYNNKWKGNCLKWEVIFTYYNVKHLPTKKKKKDISKTSFYLMDSNLVKVLFQACVFFRFHTYMPLMWTICFPTCVPWLYIGYGLKSALKSRFCFQNGDFYGITLCSVLFKTVQNLSSDSRHFKHSIFKLSLGLVSKMSLVWPQVLTKYIEYQISLSSFNIPGCGPKLMQYFQETDFSFCSQL